MNNTPSQENFSDIIVSEQNNLILMKYSISIFLYCNYGIIFYNIKNEPGVHFQELFCTMEYVIFT